ncbi:MAG TPA: hypothetical protein VFH24_07855 [Gemmatimonadales bacterium]|nr:hypothetical protein [Gemmatimonadales bacterium]
MITTLAFRHLLVRKVRSVVLLLGFALGVGVMIVLLSVGQAMLDQSRDVSLVGGGEVTLLPQGIDVEAMRTGGLSGMFFGIDRARFLTRQALGGPRHADLVRSVSPMIEGKLLYLRRGDRVITTRAGGEIPSRAKAVGSGLKVISGTWGDSPTDSVYIAPTPEQLYHELDRFHLPRQPDSSWAEWHYFNLVISPNEWWYITYLLGGEVGQRGERSKRWGGQLLLTHRRPDGKYERFATLYPSSAIGFDTTRADLRLGRNTVHQRDGVYHLRARIGGAEGVRFDLSLRPTPNRYFPPVELRDDEFVSGYVVPGLIASATGTICVVDRCRRFSDSPAYHDHNWGVWRDVTWEWGAARGSSLALLYGGVYGPDRAAVAGASAVRSPFFLTLVDSLGVRQVLRFGSIEYTGSRPTVGGEAFRSPERFELLATRDADSVRVRVQVVEALATEMRTNGFHRGFLQMRGRFTVNGTVVGKIVADSGTGFFETYVSRP